MLNQINLKNLSAELPYKWKIQTANSYGCQAVAYIDARAIFDRLDEVVGQDRWMSDFKLIDQKLYGGISIYIDTLGWVTKWDCGTESASEQDKGQSSDALKRAAVQWGVGRFLYSLGMQRLKSVKNNKDKFVPIDDNGEILYTAEAITKYINTKLGNPIVEKPKTKKFIKVLTNEITKLSPISDETPTVSAETVIEGVDGAFTKEDFKILIPRLKDAEVTGKNVINKHYPNFCKEFNIVKPLNSFTLEEMNKIYNYIIKYIKD